MFANLGPVAGPRNFTDVIPWLQGDPINGPPPLCLSVQQPNGVLDSNGPVRRHRRNSAFIPFLICVLHVEGVIEDDDKIVNDPRKPTLFRIWSLVENRRNCTVPYPRPTISGGQRVVSRTFQEQGSMSKPASLPVPWTRPLQLRDKFQVLLSQILPLARRRCFLPPRLLAPRPLAVPLAPFTDTITLRINTTVPIRIGNTMQTFTRSSAKIHQATITHRPSVASRANTTIGIGRRLQNSNTTLMTPITRINLSKIYTFFPALEMRWNINSTCPHAFVFARSGV